VQDLHDIEENLRVIRRLMERGRRYEAITGRGALVGGTAALAVAALVAWLQRRPDPPHWAFLLPWLALALLTVAWVVRAALRIPPGLGDDGGRGVSAAARAVGRAVLPAYVAAAAMTVASAHAIDAFLPAAWMCLHGVAILATSYHAPRRLAVLGGLFLAFGAALLVSRGACGWSPDPNLVMAAGFGGLHVGYGLFSVLRPLRDDD
jgi:hypothetical protein